MNTFININQLAKNFVLKNNAKFEWGALASALFPECSETCARMRLMNMRQGKTYRYSVEQIKTLKNFFNVTFDELFM